MQVWLLHSKFWSPVPNSFYVLVLPGFPEVSKLTPETFCDPQNVQELRDLRFAFFSFLETKLHKFSFWGTKLDEWTLKGTVNFMAGKVPSKGTETPTVAVLAQPNVS